MIDRRNTVVHHTLAAKASAMTPDALAEPRAMASSVEVAALTAIRFDLRLLLAQI